MRLAPGTVSLLPASVRRPQYRREGCGTGIVHLGIGAFHRAHQAVYVDDALGKFGGDWRIVGVSLRSSVVREQLAPQDGLYTLVVRDGECTSERLIGAVARVLVAAEDPAAVISVLADPATHIVTLTVTEKGYCHDPATGELDFANRQIISDLANGDRPQSAIGFLAAGCAGRMGAGLPGLTIMSCDNLPGNGQLLKRALIAFAKRLSPPLAIWIANECRFPATMIDRIVPATTDEDRTLLEQRIGLHDAAMVKAEPFSQWVIEDDFAGPRPAFEDVGAQLVADVTPFELAKLRMLNGSHSAIAYMGLARGHAFVHQAIADPVIAPMIDRLMAEAAATLPVVPGLDPAAYAAALKARFGTSELQHRLAQIAMDGSQKLPQRLLGTIRDRHAAGSNATAAIAGVRAWIDHFASEFVDDPMADRLCEIGRLPSDARIAAALGLREVFGDLGDQPWFAEALNAEQVVS